MAAFPADPFLVIFTGMRLHWTARRVSVSGKFGLSARAFGFFRVVWILSLSLCLLSDLANQHRFSFESKTVFPDFISRNSFFLQGTGISLILYLL